MGHHTAHVRFPPEADFRQRENGIKWHKARAFGSGTAVYCSMEEVDIRRVANLMMRLHGQSAQRKAALQANKMRDMGDGAGFHTWTRVRDTIKDLERNCQAPQHQ